MDNPQHQDKAPPMKTAEEFLKEEVKSARNGIALFLLVAFTFCRFIQVHSRRPGTSGVVMMIASMFSVVPFIIFYEQRVLEKGVPDSFGPGALVTAFLILLAVDFYYAMKNTGKKIRIPARSLGRGKLDWLFPKAPPALVGFLSDMASCLFLILLVSLFNCPIQEEYLRIMAAWLVLTHAAMAIQFWWFAGRIRQTRKRATYYHKQVKDW